MDSGADDAPERIDSLKRLALYCYSAGENSAALATLRRLHALAPDDLEVRENIGVLLRLDGKIEEAVGHLLEVHRLDPARVNVCDALAHCYANLGGVAGTQRFGRLSLELKDLEAAKRNPLVSLPGAEPPPYIPGERDRHVIAFSLWGENPRYLRGAIRNATAAGDIYPDWICRFYCDDSVPGSVLEQLRTLGADVVMRPRPRLFYEGLLWRFEVGNDPGITHFLVRDCDSVVNVKERVAVDEWLQSGKWFHTMRDFPSHTEVILAGMWGGIGGVLPPLSDLLKCFHPATAPTRTFDQHLLRECVWPIVRQSVLIHDSVYTGCLGSLPFPRLGALPPKNHIGQNEAAVRPGPRVEDFPPASGSLRKSPRPFFVLNGIDEAAALRLSGLFRSMRGVHWFLEMGEDVSTLLPLAEDFDLRILCVIRDPRDTASSKGLKNVSDCEDLADAWMRHLASISSANRTLPGRIEIVRYEDLGPESCNETLVRVCAFFGNTIDSDFDTSLIPGSIETVNRLPNDLLSAIEAKTAKTLAKLRYPVGSTLLAEAS